MAVSLSHRLPSSLSFFKEMLATASGPFTYWPMNNVDKMVPPSREERMKCPSLSTIQWLSTSRFADSPDDDLSSDSAPFLSRPSA